MNNRKLISVSIMCGDLMNLGEAIHELEREGIDMIHIDMMDNHFVPNITFGPDFVNAMRKTTSMPLDVHIMAEDPTSIINKLNLSNKDFVSIHAELDKEIIKNAMEVVKAKGAGFGLAINPTTHVSAVETFINDIDMLIVMTVTPGFAGGTMIPGIMDKVGEVKSYLTEKNRDDVLISVDGSVSCERGKYMSELGANVFIGGTAGIYRKGMELCDTVPEFRRSINEI